MTDTPPELPDFNNPPLVEVALSVQFGPPIASRERRTLTTSDLLAFWVQRRENLPQINIAGTIQAEPDDFGAEGQWIPPSPQLFLTAEPEHRVQMTSADDQWMWQVQRDRLVVNWRKRDQDYPRYSETRRRFGAAWEAWCEYLLGNGFEVPTPQRWAVTYVNRIPSGEQELWNSPADWPKVFPGLWPGPIRGLSQLTLHGLRGEWVWHREEPMARLVARASPSRSTEDPPRDLLMLKLTARGPVAQAAEGSQTISDEGDTPAASMELIEQGLNDGRELIVRTFAHLASSRAKEHWDASR